MEVAQLADSVARVAVVAVARRHQAGSVTPTVDLSGAAAELPDILVGADADADGGVQILGRQVKDSFQRSVHLFGVYFLTEQSHRLEVRRD